MKIFKKILCITILVLAVLTAGVLIYVKAVTYQALPEAKEAITRAEKKGHLYIFEPEDYQVNLIFYPGGFVDTVAYAPLLLSLSEAGIRVFLVRMPLGLAILNSGVASSIMANYPSDAPWYIGGHSLGGASASLFAKDHDDKLAGILFLAAYPANSANLKDTNLKILSLYGTQDLILNQDLVVSTQDLLPQNTLIIPIHGGNHAYFGHYGEQKGDGSATITRVEQQETAYGIITEWMLGN